MPNITFRAAPQLDPEYLDPSDPIRLLIETSAELERVKDERSRLRTSVELLFNGNAWEVGANEKTRSEIERILPVLESGDMTSD